MMELTKLLEAAEHGDAEAQYELAVMYQRGDGVPRDYYEAVLLYTKAAGQGHALAQAWLYSEPKEVWEKMHEKSIRPQRRKRHDEPMGNRKS